jgi:hypothetical protein
MPGIGGIAQTHGIQLLERVAHKAGKGFFSALHVNIAVLFFNDERFPQIFQFKLRFVQGKQNEMFLTIAYFEEHPQFGSALLYTNCFKGRCRDVWRKHDPFLLVYTECLGSLDIINP